MPGRGGPRTGQPLRALPRPLQPPRAAPLPPSCPAAPAVLPPFCRAAFVLPGCTSCSPAAPCAAPLPPVLPPRCPAATSRAAPLSLLLRAALCVPYHPPPTTTSRLPHCSSCWPAPCCPMSLPALAAATDGLSPIRRPRALPPSPRHRAPTLRLAHHLPSPPLLPSVPALHP